MKLSIIIPTIGRATLEEVLKALFLSTNFDQLSPEIIVVFDGVRPEKINIDERVKFLETGKKSFAAGARNMGIKAATGEVLVFIGDDTIPQRDWLERICKWHTKNPQKNKALLGKVAWIDELEKDPFHQWLEQKALFDYAKLDRGAAPTWRHFYTSNISVKKALLQNSLFSTKFSGWGFEDSEFGYRLEQQGMELNYDSSVVVKHDDPQTLEGLITRTQQAGKNAQVFERLHPTLKVVPTGFKKIVLKTAVVLSAPLQFIPKIKWWRIWKNAWLEK